MTKKISRRNFLSAGAITLLGASGAALLGRGGQKAAAAPAAQMENMNHSGMPGVVGEVDHEKNGFNPTDVLTDFDYGEVSTLPGGQTLREYRVSSVNKNVEIVPGIEFPAWTFNGRIPGPTIRCTEGDRIRIHFSNGSTHPHT